MCGRYGFAPIDDFSKKFHIPIKPKFNIGPGQSIIAINEKQQAFHSQWGLQNSYSNKLIINARIETLDEKPSFNNYRKCLIPATGWYEWNRSTAANIPYFFKSSAPWFYMAAIQLDNNIAIVTTKAEDNIAHIHDRMPLLLPFESELSWNEQSIREVHQVPFEFYAVSSKVNKLNYDQRECILPFEYPTQGSLF